MAMGKSRKKGRQEMIIEILDGFLSGNYMRWFICFLQRPMVVAIWSYTIGYFVGKS
jgi:hypothetical protein